MTAQMPRAYSAMVRSEENLPRLAVSSTAIFIHRYSGPCRITSVTSHKWAAVLHSSSSNTNKAKKGEYCGQSPQAHKDAASPTRPWHLAYSSKSGTSQK